MLTNLKTPKHRHKLQVFKNTLHRLRPPKDVRCRIRRSPLIWDLVTGNKNKEKRNWNCSHVSSVALLSCHAVHWRDSFAAHGDLWTMCRAERALRWLWRKQPEERWMSEGGESEGKVVWGARRGGEEGSGFIMRLYVCVAQSTPRPLLLLSIIATEVTVCRPLWNSKHTHTQAFAFGPNDFSPSQWSSPCLFCPLVWYVLMSTVNLYRGIIGQLLPPPPQLPL